MIQTDTRTQSQPVLLTRQYHHPADFALTQPAMLSIFAISLTLESKVTIKSLSISHDCDRPWTQTLKDPNPSLSVTAASDTGIRRCSTQGSPNQQAVPAMGLCGRRNEGPPLCLESRVIQGSFSQTRGRFENVVSLRTSPAVISSVFLISAV